MPRLALARGCASQPQQAARPDYGNPITKGLVSLANFGVAHPLGRAMDAVTGTPWGHNGTTGMAATNKGRGLLLSGNGSLSNQGFTPSAKITGPWTVFMLVAQSASGTAVVCSPATQSAPYCACFSGVWSISNTANGSVSANGTMQAVAFRQFATTADVTVNGIKGSSNAQNYGAWAAGVGYLADFGSAGGFPLVGKMTLAAIFNRALSDYEIQKLTANPWQLFRAPASPLEKMINAVSNVYGVSVAEALTALDQPNRDGASNYSVAVAESGSSVDAPAATASFVVSAAETLSGADAPSIPSAVPVVTLQQDWLKTYLTTTQAALKGGYTNPMTIAAGSAILALWAGWDATRQIPIPTINTGGPLALFTDAGSTSSVLHPNQMTQAIAGVANVSGGAYTVSVPAINDPDSTGVNGEVEIWMLEVTNLGTSFTVVDVNAAHRNNASLSWSISTDSSPVAGDLAIIIGTLENSVAATNSGVAGPGDFTQIFVNNDGTFFIPTQLAYKVLTSSGSVTATWTATDPNKTEDFGMIVVLRPAQGASPISASVGESLTTTDAPGAIATLVASCAESVSSSDAPSNILTSVPNIAESSTVADAPGAAAAISASSAESVTAADASTAAMVTPQAIGESGSVNDAPSAVGSLVGAVAETIAPADAPSAVMTTSPAVAESLTATDAPSTSATATVAVVESTAGTDAPLAVAVTDQAVAESGASSDTPAAALATPQDIAEATAGTDTPGVALATPQTVSESSSTSDATIAALSTPQAVSEASSASDAATSATAGVLVIADALATADTVTATAILNALVAESAAAADAANGVAILGVSLAEAMTAAEAVSQGAATPLGISESASATDTTAASRLVGALIVDALAATDATGASAAIVAQALESLAVADILAATRVLAAALSELATFADSTEAGGAVLSFGILESLAGIDAAAWDAVAYSLLRAFLFPAYSRVFRFPGAHRRFVFAAYPRVFKFPRDPV